MAGWSELVRGGNAPRCAVVGGGMVLHAINVFIVATILPTVVADIGGLVLFAWSTTLYVVASLLGGVACARLLRLLGARWTYRTALSVFALGCLGCAVAPSMPVLLAGRFVQGVGAGTLSALSFTQLDFPHFWGPDDRTLARGIPSRDMQGLVHPPVESFGRHGIYPCPGHGPRER